MTNEPENTSGIITLQPYAARGKYLTERELKKWKHVEGTDKDPYPYLRRKAGPVAEIAVTLRRNIIFWVGGLGIIPADGKLGQDFEQILRKTPQEVIVRIRQQIPEIQIIYYHADKPNTTGLSQIRLPWVHYDSPNHKDVVVIRKIAFPWQAHDGY